MAQNVKTDSVWLLQAKYLQMILNPSAFERLKISTPIVTMNKGMVISSLLRIDFCSILSASAIIIRAERRAVSPLVIGAAMIPSIATIAPIPPSHSFEILVATTAPLNGVPVAESIVLYSE